MLDLGYQFTIDHNYNSNLPYLVYSCAFSILENFPVSPENLSFKGKVVIEVPGLHIKARVVCVGKLKPIV